MVTLNLKNAIKETDVSKKAKLIKKFLAKIEKRHQGFYKVLDDKNTIKEINAFAKKVKGKYQDIVVLGIGGSALGTICLQKVLRHPNPAKKQIPHLHVLDNIDPVVIKAVEENINLKKTLFIVISKSGNTIETGEQYIYFNQKILDKKLDPKNHFVFITNKKEGVLRRFAEKGDIPAFEVPEDVGGRFSVLTNVGLLPAKLIGINIEQLLEGAKEMRKKFLSESIKENLPFRLALTQYLLERKGKKINVLMPYYDEFSHLNNWYVQLLSESIGKKGKGITVLPAIGVKDQHSQLQLWIDGPNDKLIMFIEVEKFKNDMLIPNRHKHLPELKIFKKQFSFADLMKLEKQGTEASLTYRHRPNLTIKIDEVSEKTLGELFILFESSIAFLGEFYSINAYNQPGVETGKKITKQQLIKNYA